MTRCPYIVFYGSVSNAWHTLTTSLSVLVSSTVRR